MYFVSNCFSRNVSRETNEEIACGEKTEKFLI